MKKFKLYLYTILCFTFLFNSCQDESLITLPEWESAVHGYAQLKAGSKDNFKNGDPSVDLSFELKWKSIDKENIVSNIDLYVTFSETYVDSDGNNKSVAHGGADGVLFKTIPNPPAENEYTSFTITQEDVYQLYKNKSYDYGSGTESVFGNSFTTRNTNSKKFIPGDSFAVNWVLTTEDGRVFDSWSPSVCTEFPEANCKKAWSVVCAETIENPSGDYVITMQDSYGDGWNGAAVAVTIDGVVTNVTIDDGSSGTQTISVPDGSSSITFDYVSGDWDSEVSFQIKSPKNNIIADVAAPPAVGPIKLDLCKE
ncbi:hypothetical protein N9L61_03030 [Flavobacteriaceae bacterium]|jgi:hypothetical protein|nr:hypothetical protein [Flavobacteriaceae bacterium]